MKRVICVLIVLAVSLLLVSAVMAEAVPAGVWICPECGRENDENFCPHCGADMRGGSNAL